MAATMNQPPEVISKYKEILQSNGVVDTVEEITIRDSGLQGENLASVTDYVTVKFQGGGKHSFLYLFTKKKSANEKYNEYIDAIEAFPKEVMFFTEYLPPTRKYCKALGHEDLLNVYPKCYYGDQRMVVFENLVLDKHFELLKREDMQDFDAARLALINLAKHHAISHVMIQESGGPSAFLKKFPLTKTVFVGYDAAQKMIQSTFKEAIATFTTLLKRCNVEGKDNAIKFLEAGKFLEDQTKSCGRKLDELLVMIHGDYDNSNMMFRKDPDGNKVIEQKIIDFQLVSCASPCVDLAYFLFTSVKPNVRRDREQLRQLLQAYLDALKVTAIKLEHPIDLTIKEFKTILSNRFMYGFWAGLFFTTKNEVPRDTKIEEVKDFAEMLDKMDESFNKWIDENPDACERTARYIIELIEEYNRYKNGTMI